MNTPNAKREDEQIFSLKKYLQRERSQKKVQSYFRPENVFNL